MSEANRSDAARTPDPDPDRDAKIEQLLLVGLDHYFAAQYEQAINVWTRALFLDRSHPRARAYIERARSALAERQRESEELLQNGMSAFQRGNADEARRLLRAAIDCGAPSEEALTVLERLDRLDVGASAAASPATPPRTSTSPDAAAHRSRSMLATIAVGGVVVIVLALAGYTAMSRRRIDWRSLLLLQDDGPPAMPSLVVREQMLPLPRRGEIALSRARALAARGLLGDALTTLDSVRPTDPQKPDADRLRADIQRQLLALTGDADPHVP